MMAAEWALFSKSTFASGVESTIAKDSSPMGVTSSFQYWDPYPISIVSAKGAWMTDVDGRQLLDLSMGFGAMLAGHLNEEVIAETKAALEGGTLFVTPSPISRDGAERLCKRFGIEKVRFANSGTEATMYAVRTAKAFTGKSAIVKLEGGYHGSYDPLTVSAKPSLDLAGNPEEPNPVIGHGVNAGVVFVVPSQGAAHRIGVQPDLICLAKSIGGGLPLAAFGGKAEIMDTITTGAMAHFGTFNGNPLAMAGLRAMDRLCTEEALAKAEALNKQALDRIQSIIEEFQLPAHTVGFGVKGCVTWSKDPVRNYRDYKATDFAIAELSWLWSMNRGIITPPGLDEQWLISLAHGQKEIDLLVEDFRAFAVALRS